jgi:hypothetical protein
MTDTLDFVKNLWGSMNIPGAGLPGMSAMSGIATPTLTTDDLDKRIADLKAVESWLNLNLSMLRTTIQTMEVQRSTLSTIKTMGASMAEAMRQSGVSAEKMANMPFAPFFSQPAQGGMPAAAASSPSPSPSSPPASSDKAVKPVTGGDTAQPGTPSPLGAGPDAAFAPTSAMDAAAAMGMPAALAWWNLLQEQFTQAVTHAMASATPPAAAPNAKAMDNPAAAPAQPQAATGATAPQDGNGNGSGNGSGRTRAGRTKADKA